MLICLAFIGVWVVTLCGLQSVPAQEGLQDRVKWQVLFFERQRERDSMKLMHVGLPQFTQNMTETVKTLPGVVEITYKRTVEFCSFPALRNPPCFCGEDVFRILVCKNISLSRCLAF